MIIVMIIVMIIIMIIVMIIVIIARTSRAVKNGIVSLMGSDSSPEHRLSAKTRSWPAPWALRVERCLGNLDKKEILFLPSDLASEEEKNDHAKDQDMSSNEIFEMYDLTPVSSHILGLGD